MKSQSVIRHIHENPPHDTQIKVCGWVRSLRVSKDFAFISLNDGSTQETLQLFVQKGSDAFEQALRCTTGSALEAEGVLQESPGKGQRYELLTTGIRIIGHADADSYPLQKKGHSLEFLREIGHLRPRTNTFGAVFRLRNILSHAIHTFFQERGFIWVHTPIITSSDCEGAGDLFTVTSLDPATLSQNNSISVYSEDFFGTRAFLTVSGQLQAEFLALSMGKVYTFGPTFRAENSNTSRHLSEFWMVEPEMAFCDLSENMKLAEDLIHFLCREITSQGEKELSFLQKQYKTISLEELVSLSTKEFTHITYSEAIDHLLKAKRKFEFAVRWGADLQSEHERYLTDIVVNGPVIVTDYPKDIKAFYMRLNDDERTVAAMDILLPGIGEIIGGSQREERLDILLTRMDSMGLSHDSLEWYLDLRRFGSVPHAGFGLGFERLVQFMTGMQNIRDVIPCPRSPKTIKF